MARHDEGELVAAASVADGGEPGQFHGAGLHRNRKPLNAQQNDACGNLGIDNTGQKLPAPTNAAANSNGNCR